MKTQPKYLLDVIVVFRVSRAGLEQTSALTYQDFLEAHGATTVMSNGYLNLH
ncbi:MAG TPA: hypothetical protein VMR33_12930 [Candidatus Baltobacteraceae bacterium]|jgi:hypothetical protein|nr:hypothetical protein [Candidatus Baltobacteraceae bacterium]